jgi:hypothetical protein
MAAGLVPAALLALLTLQAAAAGSSGEPVVRPISTASGRTPVTSDVVLRVGESVATVTLENTPAAEQFAAMLPLQLTWHDPMGQAKSGRLPDAIDVHGAERVVDLEVGSIYYWPPSGDIGVVYDVLTESVPPPGAVRLGYVDAGLATIASAGNRFDVTIDLR